MQTLKNSQKIDATCVLISNLQLEEPIRNKNSIFVGLIYYIDLYQGLISDLFCGGKAKRKISKKSICLTLKSKVQQSSLGIFIPCSLSIGIGTNFWLYRAERRIFKNLIILTSTLLKYIIPQMLFGVNIDLLRVIIESQVTFKEKFKMWESRFTLRNQKFQKHYIFIRFGMILPKVLRI